MPTRILIAKDEQDKVINEGRMISLDDAVDLAFEEPNA